MKLPFLQFYPADYLVDTRVLTLSARGAWVDILCVLHASSTRGTSSFPARGWARIMGVSEPDFEIALGEIEAMKVGNVTRCGNGDVTITCRRMTNEAITREQSRLRVQNHRNKERNAARNASGNANVTPNKLEVISQKLEARTNLALSAAPSANEIAADGIWALYPKKTGKKEAMREIISAIRANGADRIRERVQAYSAAVAQWPEDERKYVPDPVRWFKRGNYDDDPQTWQRKGAKGATQLEAHLNVF